jgi:hypothetical protein
MDDRLARQCNFVGNQQNEQLLRAMLEQDATRLAACDQQIAELERQLTALQRSSLPAADQDPLSQETEALARQVIAARQHLKRVRQDIDLLEQCADSDSQDALRWLRFELKTDSLNQALAQWAAIGAQQATRFQQELDELRRRLDSASQRVGQARDLYEQACTFESALGKRLRATPAAPATAAATPSPAWTTAPASCATPGRPVPRRHQLPATDRRVHEQSPDAQYRARHHHRPAPAPGNPNATLSDRPLMQGQP